MAGYLHIPKQIIRRKYMSIFLNTNSSNLILTFPPLFPIKYVIPITILYQGVIKQAKKHTPTKIIFKKNSKTHYFYPLRKNNLYSQYRIST